MYVKNNKSTIFITKNKILNDSPILFIHGFTGTSKVWDQTRKQLSFPSLALDVPGHGLSKFHDLNDEYTYKDFRTEMYLCLKNINVKKIHLCGYSMGGRLAVAFAQRYPHMIKSLILESAHIGISNIKDRNKRFEDDLILSNKINDSLKEFNKLWKNNNMFKQQKIRNPNGFKLQSMIRDSHNKRQLSKSLISFSKGTMPSFEEAFSLFNFPVYLINGHDDSKYIKHNRDMMKIHKKAKQFIIDKASHNVHLENNESYIDTLHSILMDCT